MLEAAAAGTTRRWCGCGTSAGTRTAALARIACRSGATTTRCTAARLMRRGTPCAAVRTRCPVCRRLRRRRLRHHRLLRRHRRLRLRHRRLHRRRHRHPRHLRRHLRRRRRRRRPHRRHPHRRRPHRRRLSHHRPLLRPPHRHFRRPRLGNVSRRCGAQSSVGNMTARTACVAAHQKGWAVVCTTRRGTRRWRGATSTALVCARAWSFLQCVAAAAGTTRRWCGCGTSARRHHLL